MIATTTPVTSKATSQAASQLSAPSRPAARGKAAPFPSLEEAAPGEKPGSKPADAPLAGKEEAGEPAAEASSRKEKKVKDTPEVPEAALLLAGPAQPPVVAHPASPALSPATTPDSPPEAAPDILPAGAPATEALATAQPQAGETPLPAADMLSAGEAIPPATETTASSATTAAIPAATAPAAAIPATVATRADAPADPVNPENAETHDRKGSAGEPAAAAKTVDTAGGKTAPKAPLPAGVAAPAPVDSGKSDPAGTDSGKAGSESPAKQLTPTGTPKSSETTPFPQTLAGNAPQPAQISPHRTEAPLPLHPADAANAGANPGTLANLPAGDGQPAHTDVAIQLHNDRLHIELSTRDSLLAARLDAASGQLASDLRHVGSDVEAINVALRGQTASDSNGGHNREAQLFNGDQGTHGGHGGHAHHPSGTDTRQGPGQGRSTLHFTSSGGRKSVDRYA